MSKELVFVPYWIYESLRRKQLGIATTLDYPHMKELFSNNDLVGLAALQEHSNGIVPQLQGCYFGHLLSSWGKSCTSAQMVELDSTIRPLSYGDGIRLELHTRLEESSEEESPHYQIVDIERDCVYLVLYPGFISAMKNADTLLEMIKKILKVFYVHDSVENVSNTEIFASYVGMLASKVHTPSF